MSAGRTLPQHRSASGNDLSQRLPVLKDMFESFNKVDIHQLTLREGGPVSVGAH
jgi:hypothetical protein